jgi:hypothetical protein
MQPGEDCASLARMLEGISVKRIQALNSGVNCSTAVTAPTSVCVATEISPKLAGCLGPVTLSKPTTCADLRNFYNLTSSAFNALNPAQAAGECSTGAAIPAGTELCMRDLDLAPPQCVTHHVFGESNGNDSCDAISVLYFVSETQLYALNRGSLDCSALGDGDKVCVRDYAVARSPTPILCSAYFTAPGNMSCTDIVTASSITLAEFQEFNPTTNCSEDVIKDTMVCIGQEVPVAYDEDLAIDENPTRIALVTDLTTSIIANLSLGVGLSGVEAAVAAEEAAILDGLLANFTANPSIDNNVALNSMLCSIVYPNNKELVAGIAVDNLHKESTCAFLSRGTTTQAVELDECLCGANAQGLPLLYCLCGMFNIAGGHDATLGQMAPARRLVAIRESLRTVHSQHRNTDLEDNQRETEDAWMDMDNYGYNDYHRRTQDADVLAKSLNLVASLLSSPPAALLCGTYNKLPAQQASGSIVKAAYKQVPVTAREAALDIAKKAFYDEEVCCEPEFCQPVANFPFITACFKGGLCLPKLGLFISDYDIGVFRPNTRAFSVCYARGDGTSACYAEDAGCQSSGCMSEFIGARIATIELTIEARLCLTEQTWIGSRFGIDPPCAGGVGFCK